jgi:hypothetical protein
MYDDEMEQVEAAKKLKLEIDKNVLGILLSPDSTVDEATQKLLFAKIPLKYAIYLQNAINLFKLYYETPQVGEVLSEENWRLLVALFDGVSDGCDLVINLNENQ